MIILEAAEVQYLLKPRQRLEAQLTRLTCQMRRLGMELPERYPNYWTIQVNSHYFHIMDFLGNSYKGGEHLGPKT